MTTRPIIFNGEMVRAILAGTKKQTRRLLTPQPVRSLPRRNHLPDFDVVYATGTRWLDHYVSDESPNTFEDNIRQFCPFGGEGDRLWVRETFGLVWPSEFEPDNLRDCIVEYRAADPDAPFPGGWPEDCGDDPDCGRWKPSIHMPRWASRITLEITGVRAEQLQWINETEAAWEGAELKTVGCPCESDEESPGPHITQCSWSHADLDPDLEPNRSAFAALWDGVYGKRPGCSWNDNPWVWVITFKQVAVVRRAS